jgi:hypothetical protein
MMKKFTSKGSTRVVYSKCRALIHLDTEQIRKSALKKLKKSKTDCASLDAKLTHFEKEEKQAHRQWLQTHCGSAVTEFRTVNAEAELLQNIIELACDLSDYYRNRKRHECAEAAVLFFESNGKIPEGFEEFFTPPSARNEHDYEHPEDDEDEADDMRAFEALLDDILNGVNTQHKPTHRGRDEWQQKQKTSKELYRRIARRLHPDQNGCANSDQLNLWYAAQKAYEANDCETLERILAHCDLHDSENSKTAPVSSIQAGIAFYKRACDQFRRSIRHAKRLPEWGFLSWTEKQKQKVLEAHTQMLVSEISLVTEYRDYRKNQLEKMRKPPPAPRRPSVKKPSPQNNNQTAFDLF